MARYIDTDILLEELQRASDKEGVKADTMANAGVYDASVKYGHGQYCYINAVEIVKDAPTADVAEVVRCKDCKHFMEYSEEYHGKVESADGDCYLRLINSVDTQFQAVCCNDFCSYGERKKVE